jgi:hypothetical protein
MAAIRLLEPRPYGSFHLGEKPLARSPGKTHSAGSAEDDVRGIGEGVRRRSVQAILHVLFRESSG